MTKLWISLSLGRFMTLFGMQTILELSHHPQDKIAYVRRSDVH